MPDQPELTPEGIAFIKSYEGYREHPYWDVQQYSIGWGTEATELDMMRWDYGRSGWQGIDVQEADERFNGYIDTIAVPELNSMLTVETTPEQYAGLVSFIYNVGQPQATAAIQAVNQGNLQSAAYEMNRIKYAGNQVNSALVSRRADEVQFLMGSVPERATQFESPSGPPSIPGVKNYADSTRFRESQAGFQPIEQTIGDRPPITYPDKIQSGLRSRGRRTSPDDSRASRWAM